MRGYSYIGNTPDTVLCLAEPSSRPWFGKSGAVEVQPGDNVAKVFPETCFKCLACRWWRLRESRSVTFILFPTQYSLPMFLPGGFIFFIGNAYYFPITYICTIQNQGHNFFPLNRSHC
uniref:Uncharacterized protein n=1 Tax=Rhipicephalus zambeziensis TaxID=60191 RepID=A0A224YI15_9ACAR